MSNESTTTTAPRKKMTDDAALACGFCGLAVPKPSQQGTFPITPMSELRGEILLEYRGGNIEFATCRTCAARHAEAARIIAAHPSIRARFGTSNAQHRLSAALDGCAALGVSIPVGLADDRDLTLHVLMTMSAEGNDARWLRQYGPIFLGIGSRMSAAATWSAVAEETREELRRAYAGVLAFRVAQQRPDVEIRCPEPVGCLMCGVGAVTMTATRVVIYGGEIHAQAEVWTPHAVPLRSLGGRAAGKVDGHLCPACERAVQAVGSIGSAALSRALVAQLREAGKRDAASTVEAISRRDELDGLAGHAVVGGRASSAPWEHVDLSEVTL